ncbi:MAG: PQQ-binding-like beta-propeller repeat protein, partial [Candidatus Thorarchaeota archaeon]
GVNGSMAWSDNSSFAVTDLMLNPLYAYQTPGIVYSTLEGYVIALNGSSGELLWNTNASLGTIWDIDYGIIEYRGPFRLLAGSEDGSLHVIALENGELLWSYNPQLGPIIGVYEVEMKSEYFSYWDRIRSNAALIATRDGYVTCVYRDGWGRMRNDLNEWTGNYEAPERIERIQDVKLNSDEVTDCIIFLQDSSILALSGATGEALWKSSRPKGPITSIAVGDSRIIAGSHDGGVYSISAGSIQGSQLFSLEGEGVSSVLIQDLDQDNSQEIIAGAENGLVTLYDSSSKIQKWNTTVTGPVAVLGIINSDNDAFYEVVVGSRDGSLFVLDGETGTIDWVADDPEKDVVSLVIDDFNGDNDDEIAIGSDDSKLYCYDKAGNLLWVYSGFTNSINRLVVADLDNDGIADIGAGSYYNVSGVKGTTGEELWRNPDPPGYVRAISQADLNQDGQSDIVVGTYERIYAIDGRTGENLWFQKAEHDVIAIDSTDVNLDGTPDFIAGTSSGNVSLLDGISGHIVDHIDVYHSVEVIRILNENDNAVEIILADGSGIRSFNVGRSFSNAIKTNSMPSDYTGVSSAASNSNSPLITDSSSSIGWTAGIAIISLLILKQARIRLKKRRGHEHGKAS